MQQARLPPRHRPGPGVWIVVVVLLATAMAGCTKPPVDEEECPNASWIQGKSRTLVQNSFAPTGVRADPDKEDQLGGGLTTFQDRPLDRIEMDFHWSDSGEGGFRGIEVHEGVLAATFWDAQGRQLQAFQDARISDARHAWSWPDGLHTNFTLWVPLSDPHEEPSPRAVEVRWHFEGMPTDPREPMDVAVAWYEAKYWYRSCTPT